jgi:precorrin-2 dehydrogenase/sirohydrochlorin ferrochelatase
VSAAPTPAFLYPVMLDLAGRPCLVVGGGAVAERKVEGLLAAGARVTVVSPWLSDGLLASASEGRLHWTPRRYRAGDVAGFRLVMVATNDPVLNLDVAREARESGVWVNSADDPARCDFTLPSVLRRGSLTVSVSTGGGSPALARLVREELEALVPPDYAELAAIVAEVRRSLRARDAAPGWDAWRDALGPEVRELIASGRTDEARTQLLKALGA